MPSSNTRLLTPNGSMTTLKQNHMVSDGCGGEELEMTFDEVMTFTRTVSSADAFRDEECRRYYEILDSLDPGSLIVEVGLEFGRSSSVALQVAKAKQLRYRGIDPFWDT